MLSKKLNEVLVLSIAKLVKEKVIAEQVQPALEGFESINTDNVELLLLIISPDILKLESYYLACFLLFLAVSVLLREDALNVL